MECRDAQFYLRFRRPGADDLAPDDAAALDRHLARCHHCAAEARYSVAFDAAIGTAMRAVPVPAGLRERLLTSTLAQRGTLHRRRAYRMAAVAASLLLVVGLVVGVFTAARPQPATYELAVKGDDLAKVMGIEAPVGFGPGPNNPPLAQANETAVRDWLRAEDLPTDLPEPFDYGLLVSYGWEEVQGRKVPVVLFRGRDHGFAKVYAFRSTQFNLKAVEEAQSSYCTAKPYPTRDGVSFLVVFTGRDLTQFTRGHNPGGPVAMAL